MKLIVCYLMVLLMGFCAALVWIASESLPPALEPLRLVTNCGFVGGIGGCVYCLRGVYLNASVRKRWDDDWQPWYYIRPIVSVICGCVSFLFLKAGLLILEASKSPGSSDLGFYALSFIAGLNVDRFIAKIEGIAHATWGIEPSRTAKSATDPHKGNDGYGPPA
jgi:hypothetical protein